MHVLVLNTVHKASGYYRVREPVRAVVAAALGVEVTVVDGLSTTMSTGPDPVVLDVDDQGADVVVMQLPKTEAMLQCLRILQSRGIAVVVESDDLLSAVPAGFPGHEALVRGGMGRIAAACGREADAVTVSTPALLAEYAPHGRGHVVPNAIPRRVAELAPAFDRPAQQVTIGWAGSVYGHRYDLAVVGSGLQQALDGGGARFLVLGQVGDAGQRLGLREQPQEVVWKQDVDEYVQALGELFDIGIAPLRDDRFNTAKSWLKVLEYSARGIYAVRSASPEYERLGLGWRARSAKDWSKGLGKGVRDADWRHEQARTAREAVLDRHLTEHTVSAWVAAWQHAAEHRETVGRRLTVTGA
jgi:hypothetical protein